jgi:outer membrane protein OmpA-like peptidoglycan-associated protein
VFERTLGIVGTVIVLGTAGTAIASDQEGFQLEITPYAWLQGVDGTIESGTREASFDQGIDDLVDNVDMGLSGLVVASFNRFVLYGQYDFVELGLNGDEIDDSDIVLPDGVKVDGDTDEDIWTAAAGYRFDTFGENTVDVLVGARGATIDTELRVTGLPGRQSEVESTDTVVMLRPSFRISENWRFNPTLAYAVSGDADTHYELQPQIQYQFSDSFAFRFGYRTLHYEVEDGNSGDDDYGKLDVDFSGLMFGVGWVFPARADELPPPPPAPPPPAPKPAPVVAKAPADSDGDGVPDASDLCPGTVKGTRVGTHGCDCDVTLQLQFAFDSAELTDADRQELDRIAVRLNELKFVAGTAEGHTDSMGDDAYNLGLSERRAQAVVDYLSTKGLTRDRFKIVAHGETQPVADNGTEEGRAQNRRVVLRRTDCDAN